MEDLRKEIDSLKERVDSLENLILVEQAGILEIKKILENLNLEKLLEAKGSISSVGVQKFSKALKKYESKLRESEEKIEKLSEDLRRVKRELKDLKGNIKIHGKSSPQLVKIIREIKDSLEIVREKINLQESLKERIENLEEKINKLTKKLGISDDALIIE